MTEGGEGETTTACSKIENIYNYWLKSCGMEGSAARKFAVNQALHPAELNKIPWKEKETPREIAEFTVGKAKDEAQSWAQDRNESHWLEGDEEFIKVRKVRMEIKKILRREK